MSHTIKNSMEFIQSNKQTMSTTQQNSINRSTNANFCRISEKSKPLCTTRFTVFIVLALNFLFLTATNALPHGQLYYILKGDAVDQMARFSRSYFADPSPSATFYGNPKQQLVKISGISSEMPPQKTPLSAILASEPSIEDNIVQNQRHLRETKQQELMIGKKYDRNCFFSPVQCMLAFNNNANEEEIWNGRG